MLVMGITRLGSKTLAQTNLTSFSCTFMGSTELEKTLPSPKEKRLSFSA